MKSHLLLLSSLLIIGFSACEKDSSPLENNTNTAISIVNAIPIKTGIINFTSKNSSGNATIYQQQNGSYILAFEQTQFTSNTDVDVMIAKSDNTSDPGIKLFSVKSITDHLYYAIPSSINISNYNFLFLQSDIAETPVGSAWLK